MRSMQSAMAVCILLFAIPSWGKQASQTASTPQPTSDPQAVVVVQAAITALGGATAIGQAQSWTFQAQTQSAHSNGSVGYVISTDTDAGHFVAADGTAKPAPPIHSHFLPVLVGPILLKESQDPEFSMQYGGLSTQDSKPTTVIIFTVGKTQMPAQIWTFDSANLPLQVDFRLPAEVGARQSFYGLVMPSDYRSVSGVLYPFRLVSAMWGQPPQTVILQSLTPSATAAPNEFNGPAGDLR